MAITPAIRQLLLYSTSGLQGQIIETSLATCARASLTTTSGAWSTAEVQLFGRHAASEPWVALHDADGVPISFTADGVSRWFVCPFAQLGWFTTPQLPVTEDAITSGLIELSDDDALLAEASSGTVQHVNAKVVNDPLNVDVQSIPADASVALTRDATMARILTLLEQINNVQQELIQHAREATT